MNRGLEAWNRGVRALWRRTHPRYLSTDDPALKEIRLRSLRSTDIASHLEEIFRVADAAAPRVIVELGVRQGESTFALERAARHNNAYLVSVDVEDCMESSGYERWIFIQSDDVEFAKSYPDWAFERGLQPTLDVLFIDTSHLYEHTKAEIQAWFPLLSERGVVLLHDTNLRRIYRRHDWTIGSGWDNQRGVVRALEDFFGARFNERRAFELDLDGWRLSHRPLCNGLTVLHRLDP